MSENEDSTVRKGQGPKVAVAQLDPTLGDIDVNMDRHREAIAKARSESVDLLVFPELSLTGYRLKDSVPEVALTPQCPEFLELSDLSKHLSIVAGFVLESSEHFFFNCAVYFEDGKASFVHRKVYLPTYGMFDEQRYFARGRRIQAFDTKHGRAAILVCEDMLHPSAVTIAALDGAGLIIVPSASPARGVSEGGEVDANGRTWENYNRAMANAYGVFVVHANRAGVEDGHTFWGGSEIVGPSGETIAKAAYYQSDYITAVLPAALQRRQRLQAPVLRDEDVDLTVNELCRIRGREKPAAATSDRPQRTDQPRDRDDRPGQGQGQGQDRYDRQDRRQGGGQGGGGGPPRFNRGRGGPGGGPRGGGARVVVTHAVAVAAAATAGKADRVVVAVVSNHLGRAAAVVASASSSRARATKAGKAATRTGRAVAIRSATTTSATARTMSAIVRIMRATAVAAGVAIPRLVTTTAVVVTKSSVAVPRCAAIIARDRQRMSPRRPSSKATTTIRSNSRWHALRRRASR